MTTTDYVPEPVTRLDGIKFQICKVIEKDYLYKILSYKYQSALVDFLDFKDNNTVEIGWTLFGWLNLGLRIKLDPSGSVGTYVTTDSVTVLTPTAARAYINLHS